MLNAFAKLLIKTSVYLQFFSCFLHFLQESSPIFSCRVERLVRRTAIVGTRGYPPSWLEFQVKHKYHKHLSTEFNKTSYHFFNKNITRAYPLNSIKYILICKKKKFFLNTVHVYLHTHFCGFINFRRISIQ